MQTNLRTAFVVLILCLINYSRNYKRLNVPSIGQEVEQRKRQYRQYNKDCPA